MKYDWEAVKSEKSPHGQFSQSAFYFDLPFVHVAEKTFSSGFGTRLLV